LWCAIGFVLLFSGTLAAFARVNFSAIVGSILAGGDCRPPLAPRRGRYSPASHYETRPPTRSVAESHHLGRGDLTRDRPSSDWKREGTALRHMRSALNKHARHKQKAPARGWGFPSVQIESAIWRNHDRCSTGRQYRRISPDPIPACQHDVPQIQVNIC
jgi:hypothetical protein